MMKTVALRLLSLMCLLGGSIKAWAAEVVEVSGKQAESAAAFSATELGGQLTQLLLGLLLVIGLIFLLAWLARRVQQQLPGGKSGDTIQLLATRPLGPRERLLLVQVGKEQVLLGLTPGNIKALHVLQEPVEVSGNEVQTAGAFARRLKQALRQNDLDDKDLQQ